MLSCSRYVCLSSIQQSTSNFPAPGPKPPRPSGRSVLEQNTVVSSLLISDPLASSPRAGMRRAHYFFPSSRPHSVKKLRLVDRRKQRHISPRLCCFEHASPASRRKLYFVFVAPR